MSEAKAKQRRPVAVPPQVNALLNQQQIAAALSCSVRELQRMRSSGEFPVPDSPPDDRSPRWKSSTVNQWIESRYTRRG